MIKDDMLLKYNNLSPAEQKAFNRWMTASIAVASIVSAGLLAMALASSNSVGPREAMAGNANSSEVSAAERQPQPGGVPSAYELMIRLGGELPVQQVDEPF